MGAQPAGRLRVAGRAFTCPRGRSPRGMAPQGKQSRVTQQPLSSFR